MNIYIYACSRFPHPLNTPQVINTLWGQFSRNHPCLEALIAEQGHEEEQEQEQARTRAQLRRLQAGKSRAVYDYVPCRSTVLKLSLENGHGRECEVAISLPTTAPHTVSFPKVLTQLRWQQENTDYLVLTEVLEQARVVPLDRRWPAEVPAQVLLQAAAVIAHASKR